MQRLTEEEAQMLRNALDSYVVRGLAQGKAVYEPRKALQQKIKDLGFVLFPDTLRLNAEEEAALRDTIDLNDDLEVDSGGDHSMLLSHGDDGLWVNSWTFVPKHAIPKSIFAKLYPGETHPDDCD